MQYIVIDLRAYAECKDIATEQLAPQSPQEETVNTVLI